MWGLDELAPCWRQAASPKSNLWRDTWTPASTDSRVRSLSVRTITLPSSGSGRAVRTGVISLLGSGLNLMMGNSEECPPVPHGSASHLHPVNPVLLLHRVAGTGQGMRGGCTLWIQCSLCPGTAFLCSWQGRRENTALSLMTVIVIPGTYVKPSALKPKPNNKLVTKWKNSLLQTARRECRSQWQVTNQLRRTEVHHVPGQPGLHAVSIPQQQMDSSA